MNFAHLPFQKLLLALPAFFCAYSLQGQLLTITGGNTPPYTPQNLISNVFLGDGVEVSNIQFAGRPEAVGYFSGGQTAVGIDRGIILTTGYANSTNSAVGAGEEGSDFSSTNNGSSAYDADLDNIASSQINNVAVYTITFKPTADTLRFRYCFASEEYPEFGCSNYNDVFGFFIQGPGYPVPTNIAKIPGTNLPVAINNIHPANPNNIFCLPAYTQYYNGNTNSNRQPTYDGFTDVFTAMAVVQPCQEYTIKLAIADVFDDIYDSGVFLEAKSFGTGSLKMELLTASPDGTVTEGCSDGALVFSLPNVTNQPFPINFNMWGTATNGIDVQTIPSSLFIPAGKKELSVPIVALVDTIAENGEYIAIDVQRDPCNRDTIFIYLRDNNLVPMQLRPDTTLCVAGATPLPLDGTVPVPLPDPPAFGNQNDYTILPVNAQVASPVNVFGVQPFTLEAGVIRSVCVNIQHDFTGDIDLFLFGPDGQFIELSTDNGGAGDNYTQTCFTPTATQQISFPPNPGGAPASATPFTGNFLPEGVWSDLWSGGTYRTNGAWKLVAIDDDNGYVGTITDWTITFEPVYKINYAWTGGPGLTCTDCPDPIASPTQSTTYKVVATDSYGCKVQDSVHVEVIQTLAAPLINCADVGPNNLTFIWQNVPNATGYEINVNGTGWIPSTGGNVYAASGLIPGTTVNLQVRAIGPLTTCDALIASATCRTCEVPQLQIAATPASCFNTNDGAVTITPDGANPPYSFSIGATPVQNGSFSGLAPGFYALTVTDASGCQAIEQFNIDSPSEMVAATSVVEPVSCDGLSDGSVSVSVTGGTGNLTYKWADPNQQTTATATNLAPGNYFVTVTDANGCSVSVFANLAQPVPVQVNVAADNADCFGQNSGTATANPTGGAGNFTYNWSNGQTEQIATDLGAGTYGVTVTDANGCTKTANTIIGQPSALTTTASAVAAKCFGSSDGSANVVPAGGTSAYTFKWSDAQGQTSATATGLPAGAYAVTVTDANGCTIVQSALINQPPQIASTILENDALCFGQSNGSASVGATGGAGNFNFKWSDANGQTSANATNLPAGDYTVTITDANGCTATNSASINQPQVLDAQADVTNAQCFGNANGRLNLTINGGTTPYQFAWSSGETTQNIFNKIAGDYSVTLTDANGCTLSFSETIGQPSEISFDILPTAVKCYGEKTGSLQAQTSGGTPDYFIQWAGPNGYIASGANISNLYAGVYNITLTDAAGCKVLKNIEVEQPQQPLVSAMPQVSDVICFGESDGSVTAKPNGGTPPYAYVWSVTGQTNESVSGLPVGQYNVTVIDANNCKTTDSTFISQRDQVFAWLDSDPPLCHDGQDGKAFAARIFYGATPADLGQFTYLWNTVPPQTTNPATGLKAEQTYIVTVADADGCSATQTVTIGNPQAVEARIDSTGDVRCFNGNDGWAVASGFGGTGDFHYFWSPNAPVQIDSLAKNLAAGAYQVTVMDSHGCHTKRNVVIGQPDELQVNFDIAHAKCFGEASGVAEARAKGGIAPYNYIWENGSTQAQTETLPAGFANVTIVDAQGCRLLDSVEIRQPATPLAATCDKRDCKCYGGHDGQIQIFGQGGNAPYRYSLDGDHWNGSSKQIGLKAGIYTPFIMDYSGCVHQLPEIEVEQRGQIEVDLGPDLTIELGESLQLNASVENAAEPIEYIWSKEDSVWLSCLDCPAPFVDSLYYQNTFDLYIVDSAGCTAEDRVTVLVEKIRKVFVATGFTPNGDDKNNVLFVQGQQEVKIRDFKVFDRWGELLWQATDFDINDPQFGWDGTFRGKNSDAGIYVWTLEVEYKDGVREIFKGNTMLIR